MALVVTGVSASVARARAKLDIIAWTCGCWVIRLVRAIPLLRCQSAIAFIVLETVPRVYSDCACAMNRGTWATHISSPMPTGNASSNVLPKCIQQNFANCRRADAYVRAELSATYRPAWPRMTSYKCLSRAALSGSLDTLASNNRQLRHLNSRPVKLLCGTLWHDL